MHYLFYVTKYIPAIHTLASHLWHQQGNWGQSGVDVSKPAGYAVCDGSICLVILPAQPQDTVFFSFPLSSSSSSSSFFLSGNTSFSHTSRHSILTKLGHSDRYVDHYSGTNNDGVRGHDGVTGVKKVIFTKKASSPSEYLVSMHGDLCSMHKLDPLYKSYGPKNLSGVIWGHGGQKFIFTKKASSPSDYVALTRNLCICSKLEPLYKSYGPKNSCPGSFGVTGVKRSFSLKML